MTKLSLNIFILFFSISILSLNFKTKKPKFYYGVNGHPLSQEAYKSNIDLQINLIKKVKSPFYRIDIPTNNEGIMINEKSALELIVKIKKNGIKIMPVIVFSKDMYAAASIDECYNKGSIFGKNFSEKYKQFFDYYEIGNEEGNNIIVGPQVHGDRIEHYNNDRAKLLMAYYKGVCNELKKTDPTAKIIINDGWVHYGFFQLLKLNEINYDIIGYHGYSEMGDLFNARVGYGNVIDSLYKKFHKRIWVTELNIRNGTSLKKNLTQENWLNRNMKFLYNSKYVDAVFIYELFDEPAFNNAKSPYANTGEAGYGLTTWRNQYDKLQEKPSFFIYKTFIDKNR